MRIRGSCQNCCVLYCATQLCTVICTLMIDEQVLRVNCFSFYVFVFLLDMCMGRNVHEVKCILAIIVEIVFLWVGPGQKLK